jgi:hypothetical protein
MSKGGTPEANVLDYCGTWADYVGKEGYLPGLYIGASCGIAADHASQLVALPFKRFWRSGSSSTIQIPAPGFCMQQKISSSLVLNEIEYDSDMVNADQSGNTPMWLRKG